jgi:hypothetical protein
MIIPGDRAADKLPLPKERGLRPQDPKSAEFPLRTLSAIVESRYYSPFLLFVCSCVEKYLEGVFDEDTDLRAYAEDIAVAPTEFSMRTGRSSLRRRIFGKNKPLTEGLSPYILWVSDE